MPPNRFESEVGNFLEGSHGDRTHIKRAGHHTVTPLCGTLLVPGWAFSDAVGFTVMTSLCSGREKVRHVRSDVNANAKKFAQRGKNGLKIAVHGTLGEFFAKTPLACLCWANFVAQGAGCASCWANFVAQGAGCASCWARTLPRKGPDAPRAGRVLSRPGHRGVLLGDRTLRCFQADCYAGIFFHVAATRTRPPA